MVLGSWNPKSTICPFRARKLPFQAPKTLRSKGKMANFEATNTVKQGKKRQKDKWCPFHACTPPPQKGKCGGCFWIIMMMIVDIDRDNENTNNTNNTNNTDNNNDTNNHSNNTNNNNNNSNVFLFVSPCNGPIYLVLDIGSCLGEHLCFVVGKWLHLIPI